MQIKTMFNDTPIQLSSDAGGSGGGSGNSDQTNWQEKYETIQSQIAGGQYVTKDSYVSLQRQLESAVNERKAATSERDALSAKIVLLTEGGEKASKEISDLSKTVEQLKGQVGEREAKLERHNLIFKDFPDLAPFEADGLLPVPSGEQKLDELLKAFQAKLGTIQQKSVSQYKEGATGSPKPATSDDDKGAEALLREAQALSKKGDQAAYDAKMDQYYKAKATAK